MSPGPIALSPLKNCLTRSRINAVIELSRAQLYVQSNTLDENRDLAGCSDGCVLDLKTGSLISDDINSMVTKKAGFELHARFNVFGMDQVSSANF